MTSLDTTSNLVSPGTQPVMKTFVRYFGDDGNMIRDCSLGIGKLGLNVAIAKVSQSPHESAYKYQVFTALANAKGRPHVIEETANALHARPRRLK